MHHDLHDYHDLDALARAASAYIGERITQAVATSGSCALALSGGHTPDATFGLLGHLELPWSDVVIYQVDERVTNNAALQNLTLLESNFAGRGARIVAMPTDDHDLDVGAKHYATQLPERFDLVHLGLGEDGHTASLVPNDPTLELRDELVAITENYQGHRRMTLTYPALARADQLVWLVSGEEKHWALSLLLDGDTSIPAGRVVAEHSLVLADDAALGPELA